MKISKRILVSALILSMVILLIPGNTTATQAAKKPKLSKTRVSITVGKTKTVKMKNSAKKAKVSWKTSNKKVAKITKKVTKGKKPRQRLKVLKQEKLLLLQNTNLAKRSKS